MDLMQTHLPLTDKAHARIIRALNRSSLDCGSVAKLEVEIFKLALQAVRETIAMVSPATPVDPDVQLRRDLDEALDQVCAEARIEDEVELNVDIATGITMEWRLPTPEEKKLIQSLPKAGL